MDVFALERIGVVPRLSGRVAYVQWGLAQELHPSR